MSWYIPLAVAFVTVFLAEMGDKTQLITISLSSKYHHIPVFFGVFFGMSAITIIGVVVGAVLFEYIGILYVKIISGSIFIIFGIWALIRREEDEDVEIDDLGKGKAAQGRNIFSMTFIMTSLAEFGDKTQFVVIALTARYGVPFLVYIGAVAAFALIVSIGVILGKKISEKVSSKWIETGSGILFIIIGLIFIVEALID